MAKKKRKTVYSGIGGQAVLEGIMMKNKDSYAVAVRLPNGEINVNKWDDETAKKNVTLKKIPFVRGIFNFIDSLSVGMKTLTYSASFFEEEEDTKKDSWFTKMFGSKADSVANGLTIALSVVIAIGLFMVLPYFVAELISGYVQNESLLAIIEGLIRIVIFLIYVASISAMKDIYRLYQYHGAEHKCINCIESGRPLTVRNVMRCSRQHRRCGTSFLLLVILVSIIVFFFIRVDTIWLRVLLRVAMIPVIAGISYEILRLAGKSDSILMKIISAPGMLLQLLTTKEPDESMVEVAIAAIEEVFDWEKFEDKHFKRKMVKKTKKLNDGTVVETDEETMQIDVLELESMLEQIKKENDEQ